MWKRWIIKNKSYTVTFIRNSDEHELFNSNFQWNLIDKFLYLANLLKWRKMDCQIQSNLLKVIEEHVILGRPFQRQSYGTQPMISCPFFHRIWSYGIQIAIIFNNKKNTKENQLHLENIKKRTYGYCSDKYHTDGSYWKRSDPVSKS